jgi:hypothetical protein
MNTLDDFVEAYQSTDYSWEAMDQVIICMCDENPGHTEVSEVYAKVAIINRAYRANMQMGAKNAEWNVAKLLVDQEADKFIAPLRALPRFDRETISEIVFAHESLVQLVDTVTDRIANSFASKYLSFHALDVVPLFDSNSYKVVQQLVGDRVRRELYRGNANWKYGYHCEAVLLLVETLCDHGIDNPNLKLVDCVIYGER